MPSAIVNLDKPAGISSQDAVTRVKRFFRAKRAGHCGTLDPAATGVLIVCLDQATRFADELQARTKIYEAVLKLGESTDTQDAEGTVISRSDPSGLSEQAIRDAALGFVGRIEQIPPMYSALKKDGDPLYRLARMGVTVERPARTVEILAINVQEVRLPLVTLSVTCSKGVYIRTLCQDLGDKLGVGGHLLKLRRTAVGQFTADAAVTLDRLSSSSLLPPEEALSFLPALRVCPEEAARLRNGQTIPAPDAADSSVALGSGDKVRLMERGSEFLGLGRIENGLLRVERLMATDPEPSRLPV